MQMCNQFWVTCDKFSLTKASTVWAPNLDLSLQGLGEPPQTRNRTYQVAFLLPHAGGADHVILFPSPISESTEKIVR